MKFSFVSTDNYHRQRGDCAAAGWSGRPGIGRHSRRLRISGWRRVATGDGRKGAVGCRSADDGRLALLAAWLLHLRRWRRFGAVDVGIGRRRQ